MFNLSIICRVSWQNTRTLYQDLSQMITGRHRSHPHSICLHYQWPVSQTKSRKLISCFIYKPAYKPTYFEEKKLCEHFTLPGQLLERYNWKPGFIPENIFLSVYTIIMATLLLNSMEVSTRIRKNCNGNLRNFRNEIIMR